MVSGLVLAAGLSRRMGQPKLLLDLHGQPVICRTVAGIRAGGVDEVVVVVGPAHAELGQALAGLGVRLAVNPAPEAGQAGSIRTGIQALAPATAAVVIALGDQPALPEGVIPRLIETWQATGKAIVAPCYREGRGNPVLFAMPIFGELLALSGDRGARSVVELDPDRVALVPVDQPMPQDLDTPEDYDRLRSPPRPV